MIPTCGRGNSLVIGELKEIGRPRLWNVNRSVLAESIGTMSTVSCYRISAATGGNGTDWLPIRREFKVENPTMTLAIEMTHSVVQSVAARALAFRKFCGVNPVCFRKCAVKLL